MELGWSTLCTPARLPMKLARHSKLGQLLLDPAQAAVLKLRAAVRGLLCGGGVLSCLGPRCPVIRSAASCWALIAAVPCCAHPVLEQSQTSKVMHSHACCFCQLAVLLWVSPV